MNFDQYIAQANRYFLKHKECLRYGQALANYLSFYNPELSDCIPQDIDPYYDNSLAPEFLVWVSEKLDNENITN